MSVKLMGFVFEHYPPGRGSNERLLALALLDHADHEGKNIYPSVALLARKTALAERTVQYTLKRMRQAGWLQLVAEADVAVGNSVRRRRGRTYRVNPSWVADPASFAFKFEAGAAVAPTERVTASAQLSVSPWVQSTEIRGCTQLHPNQKSNQEKNLVEESTSLQPECPGIRPGKSCVYKGRGTERDGKGVWRCRICHVVSLRYAQA
jgi:hypothetical protein